MSEQLNGYIQIEIKNNHAICHYYPPKEGGIPLVYSEVLEYLTSHEITEYNGAAFREMLSGDKEDVFDMGPFSGYDFSETMTVKVSLDRMKATCRFWPPSTNGQKMNVKDILAEFQKRGIVYGIDQEAIMEFMTDRCYATDYVLAHGNPPVIGHDAKIDYFFNTNPTLKPKHNEDGTVDYHDLNTINGVKEGELLAKLTPMDEGKTGTDIYGREIPTRSVKSKTLKINKNIRLSEDGSEAYASVTGHVSLVNDQIFVSDLFEVPADVDNSVGNINYDGNVHVKGNVKSGFTIVAKGDVIVEGVVEDAFIKADGQIIVKRGIHGMHKGILKAKGNVIIAFIENAKVFSGGYIETGSIIYSEVNATDDVLVLDKKGYIAGGVVRAGGKIECMTAGSEMGSQTKFEVGIAPAKKERYNQLRTLINSETAKIEKITPVIDSYNNYIYSGKNLDEKNEAYFAKLLRELSQSKTILQSSRTEFNMLHQEMLSSKHSKIIIRRDIFPGVLLTISDLSITIYSKRSYCVYEKKDGEIVCSTL
ncbi:MAG: FapA family protein [Lachnospiraceae bacterium]|nr:FapA family protein [Lachnospiraceae bacterium]